MKSRWNDAEAGTLEGLDLLVYGSRLVGAGLGAAGGAVVKGGNGAGKGAPLGGLAGAALGAGYGAYKTQNECGTIFGNASGFNAAPTAHADGVQALAPAAASGGDRIQVYGVAR